MAEPSRANRIKHPSNFVGTAPPFIHHREELSQLTNILQEMLSGILRCALQVGYGRSYGEVIPLYLPFVQILPAMPLRISVESEAISTNLQDRTEFHHWARLTNRRDQDGGLCRAHLDEAIKVSRLDSSMWSNAVFSSVLPCARS